MAKRPDVSRDGGLSDDSNAPSMYGESENKGESWNPVSMLASLSSVMRGVERKSLRGVSPGESPKLSKEGVQGDVKKSFGSKVVSGCLVDPRGEAGA